MIPAAVIGHRSNRLKFLGRQSVSIWMDIWIGARIRISYETSAHRCLSISHLQRPPCRRLEFRRPSDLHDGISCKAGLRQCRLFGGEFLRLTGLSAQSTVSSRSAQVKSMAP
jgi:hypothetical protein